MKKAWIVFWGWLLLVAAGASPLWSQQSDAAADREMVRALKKDYCSLGFLVQSVADFQSERTLPGRTGFSIANLRVLVSGRLQGGFGYFIQTSMIKSPAILDAKVYYEFSPAFALDFGQLKAPFSAEFLIFAGNIDFVNRTQVVSALAPGRQIGLQGRGWIADRKISYAVGVFNGNGIGANGNDNDDFLYAGRIVFYPGALIGLSSSDHMEIGLNAAASNDEKITGGEEGRRRLFRLRFSTEQPGMALERGVYPWPNRLCGGRCRKTLRL